MQSDAEVAILEAIASYATYMRNRWEKDLDAETDTLVHLLDALAALRKLE